jgi:hypothetical protein
MTPQAIAPAILLPLFAFSLYRRVRRNIGRQPLRATQLKVRIAILMMVTLLITTSLARGADLLLWLALGAAGGSALALWGVQLTRFESSPQGIFYTPNAYLGIAVSLLLIARIVYRIVQMGPSLQSPQAMSIYAGTPMTMGLFGLVIGYYLAYCAGLLWRASHVATSAA